MANPRTHSMGLHEPRQGRGYAHSSRGQLAGACIFGLILLGLGGCAVAPPDLNPHSASETADRTRVEFLGEDAAWKVTGPVVYQGSVISFSLHAEPENGSAKISLRLYVANLGALITSRWDFEKALDASKAEVEADVVTEEIDGKRVTVRINIPLDRAALDAGTESGLVFYLDSLQTDDYLRPVRVPGFYVKGFLSALDEATVAAQD